MMLGIDFITVANILNIYDYFRFNFSNLWFNLSN